MRFAIFERRWMVGLAIALSMAGLAVAQDDPRQATDEAIDTRQSSQQQNENWSAEKSALVARYRAAKSNVSWLQDRQSEERERVIAIEETIYHPGHYRVSLARRINWLPEDTVPTMKDTDRGPRSDRFEIDENPQAPVLVDGLWENYERRTGPQETEVRIPNIDCEGCFLQVVQFMSDHPGFGEGGFTYHHCAMLNITADPELPMDRGW